MNEQRIGDILTDLYSTAYKSGVKAGADSVAAWVGQRTSDGAQKTGLKEILKVRHEVDIGSADKQIHKAFDEIIAQIETE